MKVNEKTLKKKIASAKNEYIGNKIVEADPNGLVVWDSGSMLRMDWRSLYRVHHTADRVFIYKNDTDAVIIPSRAFKDHKHFSDFVEIIYQNFSQDVRSRCEINAEGEGKEPTEDGKG